MNKPSLTMTVRSGLPIAGIVANDILFLRSGTPYELPAMLDSVPSVVWLSAYACASLIGKRDRRLPPD